MFLSDGALVSTKTPLNISVGSSWFPYMPGMSSSTWPSAYGSMYTQQLWVNVVIGKRARGTARLPFPIYQRKELGRERVDKHPLAALLREPNPQMTGYDLWLWTASTFDIYGDTFWFKQRSNGRLRFLMPLHPSGMSCDDGSWNFDNGKLKMSDIDPADLVRFNDFHPESLVRGLSRLEPLRATLENEWHARTATSSFWKRGARPGTYLTHPKNLSEPAQARLKAQMDNLTAGSDKTGVTVVLEEGMDAKPMTLTAEEAQYIETRKLNREEVCAAYDVPPPVVHILDRATFSNITEQMRSMYRDTMGAILPSYESSVERDLVRTDFASDDVYGEFLLDEVLRGDFEARQEALSKAEYMTIAEKRKVENLPYIEGTDRIFLNTATLPLDAIDAQFGSGENVAPVIPLSVARAVVGRLSWQKTLDQVDADALVSGLNGEAGVVLKAFAAEVAADGDVPGLRERILSMAKESTDA